MALNVGVRIKEIVTKDNVYTSCSVLHSDNIGLTFEVQRTVSEGGQIETVVSQVMVPWNNIQHILILEERT